MTVSVQNDPAAAAGGDDLTTAKIAALAAIGALLWVIAVIIIRFGPRNQFESGMNVISYALVFAVTIPVIRLARRAVGVSAAATLAVVNVTSLTACFLDGAAFAWFRGLYGTTDQTYLAGAGGWLLWAIGSAQLLAQLMTQGRRQA